jgi:hypothetical protein
MHNSSFYRIGETNSRHGFGRLQSLFLCSVLVLSSLMLSATLGRGANLLANGSFESPLLATNSHLWLSNGDPSLTGWTIAAGTLALENGFLPGTIGPVDGAQCLVFDGGMNPTGTSISQTFDTEVGQAYVVSFKVGKEGGAPGNMQITATVTGSAGVVLGSLAGSQSTAGWGPTEAFFFTATTAASTLTLVDTSSTTIDTDVALDNVSVLPIGPITNGLVAYYPFNGNANDESGNSNNGIVHGALLTTNRFGEANSAYVFDGISAYIETINSLPDMPSASVSFWVNVPAFGQADQYIFMDGDQTNAKDFVAHWGNNDILGVCTKDNSCVGLGLPLTNTWFHVAAVANGNTKNLRIWLNGQQVATSSSLGNANVGYHSKLDIGCRAMLYDHFFKGAIDDLRFYNRALSDSEVQQLYLYESGVPLITSQPRSQVGYWGKNVTFSATAASTIPLSYQWLKDNAPIAGAFGSSLVLTNLQLTDAGNYSIVITNAYGSTTSSNAYLTMNAAGVSLALYSGITIDGVVGLTYGIQYSTDLSNTNGWRGMANVTLSVPTELWFDVQPANQPRRYYRVVPGPISVP